MPTLYGEALEIVLKHLGNRYGRTFHDRWEFMRFAKESGMKIDFLSTPRRVSYEEEIRLLIEELKAPAK